MNKVNQPSTKESSATKMFNRKKLILLMTIVFLALIMGFLGRQFYLEEKRQNEKQAFINKPNKDVYKYKNLDEYKLPGERDGSGITFSKPVEISAPEIPKQFSTTRLHQSKLWHTLYQADQTRTIAQLNVASLYSKDPVDPVYIKSLIDEANSPTSSSAIGINASIKNFWDQRYPGYEIKMETPKNLVHADLKNNVWTVNFTASARNPGQNKSTPEIKGTGMMAVGQNTYYYLIISAVNDNWDANQDTWKKVLESIKIDQ